MPQQFILDLRWTPQGLANVPSGEFRSIRNDAIDFATANNLSFFPPGIVDRLVPTAIGPIWFVQGEESDVKYVVARFNGMGNVTAQYFDYIAGGELTDILAKLFAEVPIKSLPSKS